MELFSMFNVECAPKRSLALPTEKPLWGFKTKPERGQYSGSTPSGPDTAPTIPGKPGSTERQEYLAAYYAGQIVGQDATGADVYDEESESPFA
jgi:hypothetical protein